MDAATNSRSTRDRTAAADTTSGLSGELIPVLMRIPDVRPPARGKAKRENVTSAAKESVTTPPPSPAVVAPPLSDSYKPSFEIAYPTDTSKEKSVHLEAPARETAVTAAPEKAADRVVDSVVTAAKEVALAPEETNELPTPVANESATAATTNRRQRQRRTATEPQTSWWRTQGRTLAAVFVIALGLTIYLARGQRDKSVDTVREDEAGSEFEITSSAVSDEALESVRPNHPHDATGHSHHVAGKPDASAPPLAEHDEELLDESASLDSAEDADSSLAAAEEGEPDMEDNVGAPGIDFGDLPEYPHTDPDKYPSDGPLPRTAKTPNSSSTR